MPRQYIEVRFGGPGSRRYTYHSDGPPLAVGDSVDVLVGKPNARGYRRRSKAKIAALVDDPPPFRTKPACVPVDPDADLIDEGTGA